MEPRPSLFVVDFYLPGRTTQVYGGERARVARPLIEYAVAAGMKVVVVHGHPRERVLDVDQEGVEHVVPATQQDMIREVFRAAALGSGLLVIDGVNADNLALWPSIMFDLGVRLKKSQVALVALSYEDDLGMCWRFHSYRRIRTARTTYTTITLEKERHTAGQGREYTLQEDGTWSLVPGPLMEEVADLDAILG